MKVGVDAARGEIVEILRRPVDDDTRRILGDALEPDDAEIVEFFLPECRDAERHVLQASGAARRGDDDVVLVALLSRCRCIGSSDEHTSELQSPMRISYAVF